MLRYRYWKPSRVRENVSIMVPLADQRPPETVTKHFWLGGGHAAYDMDIRSYSDLQYASKFRGAIGREKPCTHIKEVIPPAYLPVTGDAVGHTVWHSNEFPLEEGRYMEGWTGMNYMRCDSWSINTNGGGRYYNASGSYYFIHLCRWSERDDELVAFEIAESCESISLDARKHSFAEFQSIAQPYLSQSFSDRLAFYASMPKYASECEAWLRARPRQTYWIRINERTGYTRFSTYYPYTFSYSSQADLFDPYRDHLDLLEQGKHHRPAGLQSRLCGEALSSTSFNSNSIANGLELFDLATNILSGDIFGCFKNAKVLGTSADLWLKYRYCYCTSKSDLEELGRYVATMEGSGPTVARAGDTLPSGRMHVKIMMRPKTDQLGKLVDSLTGVGAAPNVYNMWDLVPFSFVVDWFTGIGDGLESITQYGRCAAYNIQSVTTSWKWTDTIVKGATEAAITYYERRVEDSVPPYIPYVEEHSASTSTIIKRFADSVALIGG